jgi:hypothetical protein
MPFAVPEMRLVLTNPPGEEGAAGDDDAAAGADRTSIGDATAEGGGADHHRVGVTAELGRIWPRKCHWRPPKALSH